MPASRSRIRRSLGIAQAGSEPVRSVGRTPRADPRMAAPRSAASATPPRKPGPRRPCISLARNLPVTSASGAEPSPALLRPAAATLLSSSRQAHVFARHRRPRGLSKGLSGRSPPVFPQRRRAIFFRRRPCRLCIAKPKKPPAAASHFVPPFGCGPVVPRPDDSYRGRDKRGPEARKDSHHDLR